MGRKWYMVVMALVMLLCGCRSLESVRDSTPTERETETMGNIALMPQSTEEPDREMATIEPTTFQHSHLYLPDCTPQQMLMFFEEVVLDMEYSDGTGNVNLVQKWTEPIWYRIYGAATEEDHAVLRTLFDQLNGIHGFPGIYAAAEDVQENLSIHFLEPDAFDESFSDVINGEDAYGAAQFWYYTITNELYTARIGYRTDIDQKTRNSVLIEEIINTLGISDTVLRTDSVVYQYSNENTALSDVDLIILKLLYAPSVQCGMDAESCAEILRELYF